MKDTCSWKVTSIETKHQRLRRIVAAFIALFARCIPKKKHLTTGVQLSSMWFMNDKSNTPKDLRLKALDDNKNNQM